MSYERQPDLEGDDAFYHFTEQASAWPRRVFLPSVVQVFARLSSRVSIRIILAVCLAPLLLYFLLPFYDIQSVYFTSNKQSGRAKNAFAVLLAANTRPGTDQTDMDSDNYFLATRVLNYQIKHSINTRFSDSHTPFLVLVTPEVAQNKRAQLAEEGAKIIPVENIAVDWISAGIGSGAWGSVLTKLQLWTLTDYDRILCLDSDTLLIESLNGVFDDRAAQQYETNMSLADNTTNLIPHTYTFGGIMEGISGDRSKPINPNYLNAGFFMMQPDLNMYKYYMELLSKPNLFDPSMPEQNLFNYAHRVGGPMPWQHLDEKWNTNCAKYEDVKMGWKTVHGKHWQLNFREESKGWNGRCDVDPVLGTTWWRVRGNMESFYSELAV
jgi:alpha-N-acetylglucosamine transferase